MDTTAGPTESRPGSPRLVPTGWWIVKTLATILLCVELVGIVITAQNPASLVVQLVTTSVAIVLCWRPRAGAVLAVAALALCLALPPWGSDDQVLLICCVVLLPRFDRRQMAGLWLLCAAYAGAITLRYNTYSWDNRLFTRLVFLLLGSIIGLTARWFLHQHDLGQTRIADLEHANRQIRIDERAGLARELHDVVAHQLSITSLQVMAHGMSDDVEELHHAMHRIDESTRAALNELRLMVGVLREADDTDEDSDDDVGDDVGDLREVAQPVARAVQLAETLREAGFVPEMEIDPRVDVVDLSQQRTISRVLQEATTNILRNAPEGARCRYVVTTSPELVRVRVTNPMPRPGTPGRLTGHSMGYGLRGIRERVDLTGGVLVARQEGSQWVLQLDLPRPAAG